MGLCGQIFKMCSDNEINTNVVNTTVSDNNKNNNNKTDAITVNLVIPSDLNINLHLYIHNAN